MFTRFESIQEYFYNLIKDNLSSFEGLLQEKDLITDWQSPGKRNVSIVTNWIPAEEVDGRELFEHSNTNELGFMCSIAIQSGHEKDTQAAINFNIRVLQRLKSLLASSIGYGSVIDLSDIIFTIKDIELFSDLEPESDLLISRINIYGLWITEVER